jgi:hypothetical protein
MRILAFTTIEYVVRQRGRAGVRVYGLHGRAVRDLSIGVQEVGAQRLIWNGSDDNGRRLASSVYYCRIETDAATTTKRVILLK